MKIGTGIGGWLDRVGPAATRAEDQGYDLVNCGERAADVLRRVQAVDVPRVPRDLG